MILTILQAAAEPAAEAAGHGATSSGEFWSLIFVFVLSSFIGLGVIRRVSRLLHTPLMSLTNAISAIAVVGAILVAGGHYPLHIQVMGAIALFASMTNIVSGFLITNRMLKMFKADDKKAGGTEMTYAFAQVGYIIATVLFILALHWMNTPDSARKGVHAGVAGMAIAVLVTWAQPEVINHAWIVIAIVLGFGVGIPLANVPLTAVPQRTALSHAFGGLAAGLVGTAKFYLWYGEGAGNLTTFRMVAITLEIILGYLTFTGSLLAAGKLQEIKWIPQRPVTYPGQNLINGLLFAVAVGLGIALAMNPTAPWATTAFPVVIALSLAFGVLLIIPIGGADMPTVIAILNSYAGLSAVAMGFVLDNKLLITAGALDGSSGLILAIIMCKAMNRSFTNVLFGAFGQVQQASKGGEQKQYKGETAEGAAQVMEQASLVVIVPGYGMAVAQAQHKVRELYDQLKKKGITVKFAIHPVAGRMPGHMNVLLAEADIPYTDLVEMDEINPDMPQCDVCLVVGANDVVNPAARSDKSSPIYGMPIIDADKARTIFAIKRSKNPGFAGIDNELYFSDKTWMLFGDAKGVVGELVKQFAGESGMH